MGPRLAPLALLLLALCGLSSAATKPTLPTIPAAIATTYDDAEGGAYASVFGAAYSLAPGVTIPTADKKAIENGVLCAFADPNLAASLKKAVYGAATPDTAFEFELAKLFFGYASTVTDCSKVPDAAKASNEFKCVCTTKNLAIFCAAEKVKIALGTAKPTSCPKDELAKIKPSSDLLANYLDYHFLLEKAKKDAMEKLSDGKVVDELSTGDDKAKFYCATLDADVTTAVEKLPSTDYVYYGEIEEAKADPQTTAFCNDPKKKETWFGKCVCPMTKLPHFCSFHAQAQYFKEEGYLSCCKGDEKFIAAKKPADFSKDADKKAAPVEAPACATAAPPAPATNETTTPSGSTTTTFSLLAPTTALLAAAALLRH